VRPRSALAVALLATLALAVPVNAARPQPGTDSTRARQTVDQSSALVQLKGDPVTTYAKTRPSHGKKADLNSTVTKSYRAQLSALRNDFKAWLQANAPKARITGQWDLSLNAVAVKLNGTSLATLKKAPQASHVEYEGLYQRTTDDPDLALINGVAGWGSGGAANAGKGVKVAIIDSGIDVTHPCFSDAGLPARTQLGDKRFTNNKVIVAKVFYNKAANQGMTPKAIEGHGTHVAGTVACDFQTPAAVNGAAIPYAPSGVAPAALLGNYNIFPGTDTTPAIENARSEDILNALDAAYADGMDVANMSLGGGAHGIQDLLTIAVDNLDTGNMVVAVAAGNSGPGHFTVESPGSAARALSAGASSVGHFVAAPLTVGGGTYAAITGDFPVVPGPGPLTAPLAVVTSAPVNAANGLSEACSALPAGSLAGKIALIARGTCDFSTKIRYAQLAGAIAVLVGNRLPGDATAMGQGVSPDGVQPTVPAYSISLADALALKTKNGQAISISPNLAYFDSNNDYIQGDFSGQGPTDVDFRVKPDVMAPGVNVLSSIPGACGALGCWAFFQGTSMATPHLAGAAAVVRSQHPSWTAAQVRSAIVNTAAQGKVKDYTTFATVTDVNVTGTGHLDLAAAVAAKAALGPVSVSFGAIPSGSGQTRTAALVITNLGSGTATWSLGVDSTTGTGITFSVSQSSVTLAAGASATVTVNAVAAKGASPLDHQARLTVKAGQAMVAHAALYAIVK
jgi:subtilisin family serine protease